MKIELGLDKPIVIRYFIWLADLFRGDLGTSYRTSQNVAMMIGQRIQPSLMLTGVGILGAIIIGIPLGIISAYKPIPSGTISAPSSLLSARRSPASF